MNIVIEKISAFIEENCLVSTALKQRIAQHCVIDCIKLSSHHYAIDWYVYEPRAASHNNPIYCEPRASNRELRAASLEPRAASHEPRAASLYPYNPSHEPHPYNLGHEPRAPSREPRAAQLCSWMLT